MPTARTLLRGGLATGLVGAALALALAAGGAPGSPLTLVLAAAALAGALATLVGALRLPPASALVDPAPPGSSPTESFLLLAGRAESWIERARRYLLVGGLVAAVAWIPLMVFGLLVTARGEGVLEMRVLSLAGVVAFGAGAVVWWRRLVEVDHELRDWRARVERLRRIEDELLAEP